ncbi:MAG TPA: NYN domain-containing protein [Candidatus Eisenbacteria bacterium]|nr:NYN domain-containing protein [Candidatus Eisenbacteria bacterium]
MKSRTRESGVCLIDGHNLMHRLPALAKLLAADRGQEAREHLAEAAHRFALRRRLRVVLVFDGSASVRAPSPQTPRQLEIVYATGPGKADALILSRAEELERGKQTVSVITEDLGLRNALPRGVRTLSVQDFCSALEPSLSQASVEKPMPPLEDVEQFFLDAEPGIKRELERKPKKKGGA